MKHSNVQLPTDRKFGLFFSAVFLIATFYFFYFGLSLLAYAFATLSSVFLLLALAKPRSLRLLNNLWMKFGLMLGVIVSPIVLGIVFFLLFTPIAVSMRLFGRDELRLRLKAKDSYWILRSPPAPTDSFKNQF